MFSYNPLYFCVICCYFSTFISDFIYLNPLSFFLISLVKDLSILLVFSKNQLLIMLIFCISSDSVLFISALIFITYFLSSTHVGIFVVFLFVVPLSVKLDFLFEIFRISEGRPVMLWISILALLSLCPVDFGLLCSHFVCFKVPFDFFLV